jgi:hypothetical protein
MLHGGFGYCLSDEAKITSFGTERLRAGMLAGDSLWYATGGVAWGTVKDSFAFAGSAGSFPPFSGRAIGAGSARPVRRATWGTERLFSSVPGSGATFVEFAGEGGILSAWPRQRRQHLAGVADRVVQ